MELPIDAHIPHDYIAHERLRLEAYAKISAAVTEADRAGLREELTDRYGPIPEPIDRLFAVANLRDRAREAGLAEITSQGKYVRFSPVELPDSAQLRLKRLYPQTVLKPAIRTILVPHPLTAKLGGKPLTDAALLDWAEGLIGAIFTSSVSAAAQAAAGQQASASSQTGTS